MTEVHRYKVVKMLSEGGNRISYDPHGPEVVMAEAYDQLKAENEVLRKQVADLSPFKNASPQDYRASNKCLACGDYHHGLGNLPCPRCTPVAQSAMAKEANHG
ncbi:hypothetical protein [Pseudomonas juntendi]|uniref:Uncharacterized protein n=1 Tax=Pseudomonas juntendi TaxID=2666183 RepID=A0A7W2PS93_9PSED|nr:hypothetical protein [Pseudomonas juntendi]MBA6058968.1 hypothetical protein [Pseudomonas juntendi]MBA6126054.1 hypothetical protein [Pseudomonas juntendi]